MIRLLVGRGGRSMKTDRKKGKRLWVRVGLVLLGAAVCLTVSSGSALALTSLPHIEQIVSDSSSFNILEIVPQGGSGSIGYYVAGQEPLNLQALLGSQTGQAGRAAAAAALLANLQSRSLLKSDATAPLTLSGAAYTEKKPWELGVGDAASMAKLTLQNTEQATVTGTFSAAAGGDYDKVVQLAVGDSGANQVQDIDFFQYATAGTAGTYYYNPTFTALANGSTPAAGTAIYTNPATGSLDSKGNVAAGNGGDPAQYPYQYVGSWGSGLSLNNDKTITYYTVSQTNQPYTSWTPSHPYAANSGNFTAAANGQPGYFIQTGYQYVGSGQGHYSFTPGGTAAAVVEYNTVWCSLGFQNNSWFLKYVFDQRNSDGTLTTAGAKKNVTVQSVTPREVTKAEVSSANLIVLSAGFDTASGGNLVSAYQSGNDIDAAGAGGVYDAIAAAYGQGVPVLLDGALSGAGSTNMAALAAQLKNGTNGTFVNKNLYVYSGALATPNFNQTFTDTTGFSSVLSEIEYENFLRQKDNPTTTDLLPEVVTMANATRYVINFAGQRQTINKSKITVLDLEPGRGAPLTSSTVLGWLGGSSSGLSASNISIVAMPASEFIGKLDDLVETYDMIYVGSDLTGFNTTGSGSSATTVYNDSTMNGLIYTNIGDVYKANILLAGLLDRDYYKISNGSNPTWSSGGTSYKYIDATSSSVANRFRFSGNDLTQLKAGELLDFAKSGYPVVIADNLTAGAYSFNVSVSASQSSGISANSSVVLTASVGTVSGTLPSDRAYQWFKDGAAITGATSSTCSVTAVTAATGSYTCQITISGTTATSSPITLSQSAQYTLQNIGGGTNGSFKYNSSKSSAFSATLTSSPAYPVTIPAGTQVTLTATAQDSQRSFPSGSISFTWFNGITQLGSPQTIAASGSSATQTYLFTLGAGSVGTYTCRVSVSGGKSPATNDVAASNAVQVSSTSIYSFAGGGAGSTAFYSPGGALTINTSRVDSASCMYAALNSIKSYKNVMSVSEAGAQSATLDRYLNLSKPSIVWQNTGTASSPVYNYPPAYNMSTDANNQATMSGITAENGKYYLRYGFTIQNPTDATPETTTYDCRLYIDQNADGLFKPDEQITDIIVRDVNGRLVSPVSVNGVNRYQLKAGTLYTVSRQMPTDYAGIIPWKMEIVKNDNEYIHTSEVNYTRIAPSQPDTINILQINSYLYSSDTLNLQQQLESSNTYDSSHPYQATRTVNGVTTTKYFYGLFGQLLYEVPDFNVDVTTITAPQFNGMQNQADTLSEYNMLIIGFGDMYQELNQSAANAVVSFIGTGKSVLFTHDTTSLTNVPDVYGSNNSFVSSGSGSNFSTYQPNFSDPANWGYYFNTILRDAVKLDRYGITSSSFRPALETQTASTDLTASQISAITAAGHSVAFAPGSDPAASQTVPETQGFTNYSLMRYGVSGQNRATSGGYSSGRVTQSVSQINKGQITTYPYDINTSFFENGTGTNCMTVAPTHEQYYQLDMNSNDIVVWYCLSNGDNDTNYNDYYAALPNDVTNAYYIYNCGNVTYSGMGHFTPSTSAASYYTGGSTTYMNEAKLFVNTMIASYRAGTETPTVSFTSDASGSQEAQYLFLNSDYASSSSGNGSGMSLLGNSAINSDAKAYFEISDPSLQQNKNLYLTFYYTKVDMNGNEGPVQTFTTSVYNADTGDPAATYSGGLVYDIALPPDIVTAVQDSTTSAVNLYISIGADTPEPISPATDAKIQIRQIGLFALK